MASAHLNAKVVSRGSGHSSVAAAAYNAREELEDRRTGETHDFTRHSSKCLFQGIYAPKDAPAWAHDRAQLWNHVEVFERHRRAQLAQNIDIALPHELTLEQNRWLLQDWVKENATRKGLIADVAIHAPDRRGDERNIHAHVLIVLRKLDGSEFVRAKERFDTFGEKTAARTAELTAMRESWGKLANRHLERHGHEARIDMGRKQDGDATLHMGRHATAQERRGDPTELGDRNREIAAANENARHQLRDRIKGEIQQGKENRAQIREDVRQHVNEQAAKRGPAAPQIDLGAVERERQADAARQQSDRTHAPENGRGGQSRGNPDKRVDDARQAGRVAGQAAGNAVKVAGGLLGLLAGVAGSIGNAASPPPSKTPQKGREAKPPRSLADITRDVEAKQAAAPKPAPAPEKEKAPDRDQGRHHFTARPMGRLCAAIGFDVGWAVTLKFRLLAYSMATGEDVVEELNHLVNIITGNYLALGLTLTGRQPT